MGSVGVVFVDGGLQQGAAVPEGIVGGSGVEFFFEDAVPALDTPVILRFFGGQDEQVDAGRGVSDSLVFSGVKGGERRPLPL
jgi:hypothetical protein